MITEKAKAGFTYLVEVVKDGVVLDSEVVHNIVPLEGIHHALGVLLLDATKVTQWYIGLYENDYTPVTGDVMSTFPTSGVALEVTTYAGANRLAFTPGAASAGSVTNATNRAEFEFNATKTVRGGFISSSGTKAGTTGVLLSAVKFASAKSMEDGAILRVTAGLTITST